MIDAGSTEVRSGTGAVHLEIARRTTLGLGIAVCQGRSNTGTTSPSPWGRQRPTGDRSAWGTAGGARHPRAWACCSSSVHSLVVSRSCPRPRLIVLSALFLLALLGAASSGASFVDSGRDSASASMAMLTGVALICSLISLYVAGRGSGEVTSR